MTWPMPRLRETGQKYDLSPFFSVICGPEGWARRKNDGAFQYLPKNMPGGSAAAAISADQTVAIGLVAALFSQVARFEDQRRNRWSDPVARRRGIVESKPPGDQRRGGRGAAQAVGRLDAGRGEHGVARCGEVERKSTRLKSSH